MALKKLFLVGNIIIVLTVSILGLGLIGLELLYQDEIYPGVTISGYKPNELPSVKIPQAVNFSFENNNYTLDTAKLGLGYDVELMSRRALSIGRQSNSYYNNLIQKLAAITGRIDLPLEISYDQIALERLLAGAEQHVYIPAVDAQFKFEPLAGPDNRGRVVAFQNSRDGREIDRDSVQKLIRQIVLGEVCSGVSTCELPLPIKIMPPKLSAPQADHLGLKNLLGTGESYFYDSIPGRVENIRVGTEKINGSLVAPGEVFSFSNAIGTVSAIFGFKKAYAIIKGKTTLDDGGGVCQVSTTLYRAALNSGLPIVERAAHSYRVGFYEQGGFLPGLDATVYPPSPDLKIENDTPGWILLQAKFNPQKMSLTFEVFGTDDGRKTTITKPVFISTSPPPEPIFEDDPGLLVGIIKQVDTAHPGAKVYFKREVTRDGQPLISETVYSDYVPWPARFLRGIKTN